MKKLEMEYENWNINKYYCKNSDTSRFLKSKWLVWKYVLNILQKQIVTERTFVRVNRRVFNEAYLSLNN